MRRFVWLLLSLLLLLAACRGRAGGAPTPFPTAAATPSPTASGPIALTVTELAAAPGLYLDALVQVTGVFRKQPLLVCEAEPFRSPATWGLGEEGLLVLAGGYDQQVRGLLPEGLLMTAEGRWQRWEGLVGCGKSAVTREVWYLNVGRILSPSPLTQVTLTPGGPGTAVAEAPTLEAAPPLTPTEDFSFPTPVSEESPTAEPTFPVDDFPAPTEELLPTASLPTPDNLETPTLSVTAASETPGTPGTPGTPATPGTGTPTVTGTPPTATPTVTGTPPTATPTTPSGPGQIITKGSWDDFYEGFVVTTLAAGTTDRWDQEVFAGETYTIYVIAAQPADLVVSLLREDQTIINRQNTAAPGVPEIIAASNITGEGDYQVHVTTANGAAADYAILSGTDEEFPTSITGYITLGTPRTGVQMPENATHYWFFTAAAGDEVTIVLDPTNGDFYFDLYDAEGESVDSMDAGGEGETETLNATLATSGLYAISLAEIDGIATTYNLSVTRQ